MTGYCADTRVGRVQAAEQDTIFYPRTPRAGRYGVVLLHGAGTPAEYIDGTSQRSSVILAAAITSAGIPCIAGDFGFDTWANDTGMSRITAARSVLASAFPTMATDKVCLLGVSHGGSLAARYSQLYPSQVAGVVGIIPAFDIKYEWDNISAVRAGIGAAWGVTWPTALPSAADLGATAAHALGVPHLIGYSSIDTTVPPTPVIAYAAAVRSTPLVIDSTSGHSDATVGKMSTATVISFLEACGA